MKEICLFIAILLSGLGMNGQANRKTVLLLGTAHSFKDNPNQDFEMVKSQLLAFKPELICVEGIDADDSVSLYNFRKENVQLASQQLAKSGLSRVAVFDSIDRYRTLIKSDTENIAYHIRLAQFFFLSYDFNANSDYHWWIANVLTENKLGKATSDSIFKTYKSARQFNEYFNLVFPLAFAAGIETLYPIDDQTDHPADIQAQKKLTKRILFSFKGIKAYFYFRKIRKQYNEYQREGKLFSLLNDSTYQNKISDLITNSYPKWSKSHWAKEVSDLWKQRNQNITRNILNAVSKEPTANRIIVTIGAAHVPILKSYLIEKGFDVIVLSQQNQNYGSK